MKQLKFILIFLLCLTYVGHISADEIQPKVELSTPQKAYLIGDHIQLFITVTLPQSGTVFKIQDPELKDMELLNKKPAVDRIVDGKKQSIFQYDIIGFSVEDKIIEPISVEIAPDEHGKHITLFSNRLSFKINSVLKQGDSEIKDIKPNLKISLPFYYYLILIPIILCIAALSIWIKKLLSKKSAQNEIVKSPEEIAQERFVKLKDARTEEKQQIKDYYLEMTGILRDYISDRYRIKAPEMTSSELMKELTDNSLFPDAKLPLRKLLSKSDEVKFCEFVPEHESIPQDLKSAEEIYSSIKIEEESETK